MSSRLKSCENESRICTSALDDEGHVLALANTGKVALCAAGGKAYGVGLKSTKNLVTGVAAANKSVAVLKKTTIAKVKVWVDNADPAIVIGDYVSMKGANASGYAHDHEGTVLSSTPTKTELDAQQDERAMIVGIALEAVASPGSGETKTKIDVLLTCPSFGRQE